MTNIAYLLLVSVSMQIFIREWLHIYYDSSA